MRKHRLGKQLLIVLCVSLLVFLAGCRPSPVLEQIIYEQQHEIDEDVETQTMDDDMENEEPDENIPPRETVDDAAQEKNQEYRAALAGDTDTDSEEPDAVYDVAYSPVGELSEPDETNPTAGSTSEKATGSTKTGGEEAGETPSGEGEDAGNEGASGESDTGTDAGEEPTDGGNGELEGEQDTGTGYAGTNEPISEPRQIVDAAGRTVEVPQNVDTVTAVGEIATIVEMLGGSGRLVGSSSSFTGSSWVQSTFDLNGVNTWWNEDGSSACVNFDALLASQPDVCFEISGQETFSSDQITRLDEAGIAYVVLPKLSSISNIESAVTIVGQVLGDRESDGLTNAESIASSYCSWANNMISEASGNHSTKATTYIERWDNDAYWTIQSLQGGGQLAAGKGVPICMAYAGNSPLAECMGYAGVINTAADNYYVEPLYRLRWEPTITGGTGKFPTNYRLETVYSDELGVGLGTEAFPAVIVADSSIRDNIYNANDGDYYKYHWQPGEQIVYNNSRIYGISLPDGTFLSTRIQNEYEYKILINPSGVGSWAKGSVESPMEAVWLANKFQGLNVDLRSMVSDFYSTFYHVSVDPSAVMPE